MHPAAAPIRHPSGAIVADLVQALDQRGDVAKAADIGIEREAIFQIGRRLKPEVIGFAQAVQELGNALAIARDLIIESELGTPEGDFVEDILKRLAEATKRGDFDAGKKAVDSALASLGRTDQAGRAARPSSRKILLEAGVKLELLRRDPFAAAQRIEAIAAIETPEGPAAWSPSYWDRFNICLAEGEIAGVHLSLEVATEMARRMADTARDSDERGAALVLLGNALRMLGERESGRARLGEAVAAYREALLENTRARVTAPMGRDPDEPRGCAQARRRPGERHGAAQRSCRRLSRGAAGMDPRADAARLGRDKKDLGAALATLGEREGGTARLAEAAAACRDALREQTRERGPLQWAATQVNLGNVLMLLGERESGTARLQEAVTAYREALREQTRESPPREWAGTQVQLGAALYRVGERQPGTAELKEAAGAFREALREHRRDSVPLLWAMTQNNLGLALALLGERQSGTAELEEAAACYHEALKEYTRARLPLDWASTQNNLGLALTTLGQRESGTARLKEAVAAFRLALREFTRERVPPQWSATKVSLGLALLRLGERQSGTARLEVAAAAFHEALKERPRERAPVRWAAAQLHLAEAALAMFTKTVDANHLDEALERVGGALEEACKAKAADLVETAERLCEKIRAAKGTL